MAPGQPNQALQAPQTSFFCTAAAAFSTKLDLMPKKRSADGAFTVTYAITRYLVRVARDVMALCIHLPMHLAHLHTPMHPRALT